MTRVTIFCIAMIAGSALRSNADPVTLIVNSSTPYTTTALTGFATFGDQLAGMMVTATRPGGVNDTAMWAALSSGCGSVSGTGWSVAQCGDTFETEWTLDSTVPIASLFFDAGVGNAVFDLSTGDFAVTEGSARGLTFTTTFPTPITATYSGPVALGGSSPAGDLFRFLQLDFTSSPFQGTLTFMQDADSLRLTGDLSPAPVPEPASVVFLTSGLAGLALRLRRKRL
jgi:hypothetical protein